MEGGGTQDRIALALERMAEAAEKLNTLAEVEKAERSGEATDILPGLPVCPHCGTFNPSIRNEGGTGPWAGFVLLAVCENCHNTLIAEPQGWNVYKDRDEYEGREE